MHETSEKSSHIDLSCRAVQNTATYSPTAYMQLTGKKKGLKNPPNGLGG